MAMNEVLRVSGRAERAPRDAASDFTGHPDHLPAIGKLRAKALQRCSAAVIAAAARTRVIANSQCCGR
jgi:hypothetical protein